MCSLTEFYWILRVLPVTWRIAVWFYVFVCIFVAARIFVTVVFVF